MTHEELIVGLYNEDNPNPIRREDYVFDKPKTYTAVDYGKNTKLTLRPLLSSGLFGGLTIYYDRIDLQAFPETVVIPRAGALYLSELLEAINEESGLLLTPRDIEEVVLPAFGFVNVVASPDSLLFTNSKVITIT